MRRTDDDTDASTDGAGEKDCSPCAYDERIGELFDLSSKRAALEARAACTDPERAAKLRERTSRMRAQLDDIVEEFNHEDFAAAFRRIEAA